MNWPDSRQLQFQIETGNQDFRRTVLTWVNLIFLLLLYPVMSIFGMGSDPTSLLRNMTPGFLIFLLITTILFQWAIFLLNYGGVYTERTGLIGVGLKRIRALDFAWAAAFLAAANLLLSGLAWLLAQIGLPMPGEIQFLIPEDAAGRVVWVLVSFTAGFCEEVGFRGYLMTRLRLIGRFQSWLVPTIVSALIFGACHAYQGWPGFIVLSIYGAMFSLLYIRTGSLWPCIIAHSMQDLGALIFPQ